MGLFSKKKDATNPASTSVKSSSASTSDQATLSSSASTSDQTTLSSFDLKPEKVTAGADDKPKTFTDDPAFWERVNKYRNCEHYAGGWTGMAGELSTPQTDAEDSQAAAARVQKERANTKWYKF